MLQREALAENAAIVKILLERGARPEQMNAAGLTAFELARHLGWPKVEALLGRG